MPYYILKQGLKNKNYLYTGEGWTLHVLDAYPFFSIEEAEEHREKDNIKGKIIPAKEVYEMIDEGGSL